MSKKTRVRYTHEALDNRLGEVVDSLNRRFSKFIFSFERTGRFRRVISRERNYPRSQHYQVLYFINRYGEILAPANNQQPKQPDSAAKIGSIWQD